MADTFWTDDMWFCVLEQVALSPESSFLKKILGFKCINFVSFEVFSLIKLFKCFFSVYSWHFRQWDYVRNCALLHHWSFVPHKWYWASFIHFFITHFFLETLNSLKCLFVVFIVKNWMNCPFANNKLINWEEKNTFFHVFLR